MLLPNKQVSNAETAGIYDVVNVSDGQIPFQMINDDPGLGEMWGHGCLFYSQAFFWPEQNVTIEDTLISNEPPLGFTGMMIEVMNSVQSFSEG